MRTICIACALLVACDDGNSSAPAEEPASACAPDEWWCVEGGEQPDDPGAKDPGDKDPGDKDPGDKDPDDGDPGDKDPEVAKAGALIDGELDTDTGEGAYRFQVFGEDGAVLCGIRFPVSAAAPNDTCTECAFAFDLPLGSAEWEVEGDLCQDFAGLGGLVLTYGHADPDQIWIEKGGWQVLEGTSSVDGTAWRFETPVDK